MATSATTDPTRLMIDEQLVGRGIRDARVLDAIAAVPRNAFVPADIRSRAFDDCALPIGYGQTISQPYIVALMTEALHVRPNDHVLEIGTGSGYQAAVLSKLVAQVFTIERVKPLLDGAFETFGKLNLKNIHLKHADGSVGWADRGPFDRIVVTAAAPDVPAKLIDQLKEGGIMVLPTGTRDRQQLMKFTKQKGVLTPTALCDCRFVPLLGEAGWTA